MKQIISLLIILISLSFQAQTTTHNLEVKLNEVLEGTVNDSILVYSADKKIKRIKKTALLLDYAKIQDLITEQEVKDIISTEQYVKDAGGIVDLYSDFVFFEKAQFDDGATGLSYNELEDKPTIDLQEVLNNGNSAAQDLTLSGTLNLPDDGRGTGEFYINQGGDAYFSLSKNSLFFVDNTLNKSIQATVEGLQVTENNGVSDFNKISLTPDYIRIQNNTTNYNIKGTIGADNTIHELFLPQNSGTFALTSDIDKFPYWDYSNGGDCTESLSFGLNSEESNFNIGCESGSINLGGTFYFNTNETAFNSDIKVIEKSQSFIKDRDNRGDIHRNKVEIDGDSIFLSSEILGIVSTTGPITNKISNLENKIKQSRGDFDYVNRSGLEEFYLSKTSKDGTQDSKKITINNNAEIKFSIEDASVGSNFTTVIKPTNPDNETNGFNVLTLPAQTGTLATLGDFGTINLDQVLDNGNYASFKTLTLGNQGPLNTSISHDYIKTFDASGQYVQYIENKADRITFFREDSFGQHPTILKSNSSITSSGDINLELPSKDGVISLKSDIDERINAHGITLGVGEGLLNIQSGNALLQSTGSGFIVSGNTFEINSQNAVPVSNGINVTGLTTLDNLKIHTLHTAPSSSTAQGQPGEIRITADYIYVCTGVDSWKRTSLASF